MEVLWEKGQATAREIADVLNQSKNTAFTTVQTMCKVLLDKGYVEYHKQGRAFVYTPITTQEDARNSALDQLLSQFFAGSPTVLAEHLLQEDQINGEDLKNLQNKLDLKKDSNE